jgi:hypothetical protein
LPTTSVGKQFVEVFAMSFHRYISNDRGNKSGSSHRLRVEVRYSPEEVAKDEQKPLPKTIKELEEQRWKQKDGS